MTNARWISGVLLAVLIGLGTPSCKKTNGIAGGNKAQNLQQYFSSAPQFTLFNRALQRTHVDTLLGGTTPYTVFAADDSAMTQAGWTSGAIDSADPGTLTRNMLFQLVQGSIASTDVQLYQETLLTSMDSGYTAYLEYNNFGLFYNGTPLVKIDNQFVNGIVQQVQTPGTAPLGDLRTTIARLPQLSDFNYTFSSSNFYYSAGTQLAAAQPSNPVTAFVPDNTYYASLGLDNYFIIQTYLNNRGTGLPAFYVAQGQFFVSDFIGENAIPMSPTGGIQSLWFSNDGLSFYLGNTQAIIPADHYKIRQSNIVATNGIIHIIEAY